MRGERTDLNGPFLSRSLLALGLEPARIEIVGDDPRELEAAFREAVASADLVVSSGGLGPTHDDRTVEILAQVAGLELRVDERLEAEIEGVSARGRADEATVRRLRYGVRKQATLPEGAISLGLAGTAPGLVVEANGTPVVILPGPPVELQRLWPNALETEPVKRVLAGGRPPLRRTLRLFGLGESQVAQAFQDAGGDGGGLEVTICARDFEVHMDLVAEPETEDRLIELERALAERLGRYLIHRRPGGGGDRPRSLPRAWPHARHGGVLHGRPGRGALDRSARLVGRGRRRDRLVLERRQGRPARRTGGADRGARGRVSRGRRGDGAWRPPPAGVDVAVSVTGVAGPGGGTEDKPVGLVYFHVETPDGGRGAQFSFPGDRDSIRRRAVVGSLHLLRRMLEQNRDTSD